jgi:hypothetical protein
LVKRVSRQRPTRASSSHTARPPSRDELANKKGKRLAHREASGGRIRLHACWGTRSLDVAAVGPPALVIALAIVGGAVLDLLR